MTPVRPKYRFAVIATDVVILTIRENKLQVLLMKMRKVPYQRAWAVPGGLVNPLESVDDAARRHLHLKTGVQDVYLEQLYTFGRVDRDPFGRVVSVAYYALVADNDIRLSQHGLKSEVRWWPVDRLPVMAYDHADIVRVAAERLRAKLEYTNIVYGLMPREFTLTQLQKTYETILGRSLDKRNFRKKILALGLVKKLLRQQRGDAHRPANLYRFVRREPQIVSVL